MYVPNFVIPIQTVDLEEVSGSGQFYVSTVLSIAEINSALNTALSAEAEDGFSFVKEHFHTFYSVIKHFKTVPHHVREKCMKLLLKSFSKMILNLSSILEETPDADVSITVQVTVAHYYFFLHLVGYQVCLAHREISSSKEGCRQAKIYLDSYSLLPG